MDITKDENSSENKPENDSNNVNPINNNSSLDVCETNDERIDLSANAPLFENDAIGHVTTPLEQEHCDIDFVMGSEFATWQNEQNNLIRNDFENQIHPYLQRLLDEGDAAFGGFENLNNEISAFDDRYEERLAWLNQRSTITNFISRVSQENLQNEVIRLSENALKRLLNPQNFDAWLASFKNLDLKKNLKNDAIPEESSSFIENKFDSKEFSDVNLRNFLNDNGLYDNKLQVNLENQINIVTENANVMADLLDEYNKRLVNENKENAEQVREILENVRDNVAELLTVIDPAPNTNMWLWVGGGLCVILVSCVIWWKKSETSAINLEEFNALRDDIRELKNELSKELLNLKNAPSHPKIRDGVLVSVGLLLEKLRRKMGLLGKILNFFKWFKR